jgi:hypothetical protein
MAAMAVSVCLSSPSTPARSIRLTCSTVAALVGGWASPKPNSLTFRLIAGKCADKKGGDCHRRHRCGERRLAAYPVTDMAEQQTSQGADQKTCGEDPKRCNERRDRVLCREEVTPDVSGEIAVDAEIVPLPATPAMMARRSPTGIFEPIPKPHSTLVEESAPAWIGAPANAA